MAVSVLFGSGKAGKVGELQLDAVISEVHDYENHVTKYPIEDGSTITDNVRIEPERLQMSGFISNSPVKYLETNLEQEFERFEVDFDVSNKIVNNVELAQDELLRIAGRKIDGANTSPQLITIVTGLRVYTSMAIESLRFPRDATTGQALRFEASFIKVQKVNTETIALPNAKKLGADGNKTQSTVDAGQNKGAKPKAGEEDKASFLFNTFVGG